jgi:hydrophobe/amphiphile efflux-3 (HAE3) family protein
MFKKLAEFIIVFKWPILLLVIIATVILGWGAYQVRIDPSVETLFAKSSPEYKYYDAYRKKYGSDSLIAIAMATDDLFSVQNLKVLKELTDEIANFSQVERVMSLANTADIRHKFLGVKAIPVFQKLEDGKESLADVREQILSDELFLNNLVSKDGKTAMIIVYLKTGTKEARAGGLLIDRLNKFLKSLEKPGLKFYVAGAPVEQYEFIRLIRHDQMIFIPLIAFLLVVTTFVIYRSFACMILSMSIVFTTLIWTIGTIAATGQEMNLMTSLLGPVIMIVSVINSIYLINLFLEIRPHHKSLRQTVVLTIAQLGVPCLLTHVTAILGFLSLAVNSVPAIRSFGLFAALGTFYSFFLEILLTTILLPVLPYRCPDAAHNEQHFINRVVVEFLERLEYRWKWWILALTIIVLVLSVHGIQKIHVDTNIVKQMKPEVPLAVSTKFIDDHVTGVYSLGFIFRRRDGLQMTDYKTLQMLDTFKDFLESQPEIAKVNCITMLVKKINSARKNDDAEYRIPNNPKMLARYFKGMAASDDPELWKMISPDFREIRMEARMRAVGTTKGNAMEENIRAYLTEHMSEFFEYRLTGNVVLLGKMSKDLVQEQTRSFGFAFISIFILITLIFRSFKMALLASIPNLFPILAVYGFMGYAGIELSTPTAMISSIVLGFVVDAAIQFLYRFRFDFNHSRHYVQALHHTYRSMGQSIVVSTLILVMGFAASFFASFKPTVYFGLLTSLTIFLAMICCLLVLPMFLVILKPFGKQRLFLWKKHSEEGHGHSHATAESHH